MFNVSDLTGRYITHWVQVSNCRGCGLVVTMVITMGAGRQWSEKSAVDDRSSLPLYPSLPLLQCAGSAIVSPHLLWHSGVFCR